MNQSAGISVSPNCVDSVVAVIDVSLCVPAAPAPTPILVLPPQRPHDSLGGTSTCTICSAATVVPRGHQASTKVSAKCVGMEVDFDENTKRDDKVKKYLWKYRPSQAKASPKALRLLKQMITPVCEISWYSCLIMEKKPAAWNGLHSQSMCHDEYLASGFL